MIIKKFILLFVFLLIVVLCSFSQTSVNINEYGAYFIDNGVIKKIPTTFNITGGNPWRNYIILSIGGYIDFIYNIDNGATSELLLPPPSTPINRLGFFPLRNDRNNNLIFYNNGIEYELDPITLATVRTYVWGRNENVYEVHSYLRDENNRIITWHTEEQWFASSRIGHSYRMYFSDTNYTDIIYSQNITLENDTYIIRVSNIRKQFVFIINDTRDSCR
jgi:hypothetical protein